MSNKTIAILDLSNLQDQCLEVLTFASILEKKYDTCAIVDLNSLNSNKIMSKEIKKWSKSAGICKSKVFDNSLYHISEETLLNSNKLVNLATSLKETKELLLISANGSHYNFNNPFIELADEIVIFTNFKQDLSKKILSFFLQQPIKKKKMYLIFHSFTDNIQGAKTYLSMLKNFQHQNIEIIQITQTPKAKSIKDISSIEPWQDIYKIINQKF